MKFFETVIEKIMLQKESKESPTFFIMFAAKEMERKNKVRERGIDSYFFTVLLRLSLPNNIYHYALELV